MRKVLLYSLLLIAGMALSQLLPGVAAHAAWLPELLRFLTMAGLSFLMVHVGFEFDLDKSRLRQYGVDYLVAATAAAFPWIFCAAYFQYAMSPRAQWGSWQHWTEVLLAGRFAAPTSAGVLFAMLAAAGLSTTWMYRKARILAIFDDLDTVLLMIPLKMMIVGFAWQLVVVVALMAGMVAFAWKYLHALRLPSSWPWVLGYALAIAGVSELIYKGSTLLSDTVPIHIEVLLPAFALGCVIARPHGDSHQPERGEAAAQNAVSAVFMVLVGLSMPAISSLTAGGVSLDWGSLALHVLALTVLGNIGKLVPAFCYRSEASWRERLAVAVGMFPRGEVGAGVLVVAMGYGIDPRLVLAAALALALNLLLSGVFIASVKRLVA